MSLTKKYLKSKPVCKVTFKITKTAAKEIAAKEVTVVGEFNDWDIKGTKMKKAKDGSFATTVDLEVGKEYQFRYLVNGETWTNDTKADKYVSAGVGSEENCVVVL